MSRFATPPEPTAEEREWLAAPAPPAPAVAIGGATKYWMPPAGRAASRRPAAGLQQLRGSLIVATSRRTDPAVTDAVRAVLGACGRLVEGGFPRFPVLLDQADEIFVTGDSVSMLSEAILAGKPVGMVPIEQDEEGRRSSATTTAGCKSATPAAATCADSGTICATTGWSARSKSRSAAQAENPVGDRCEGGPRAARRPG